MRLSTITMPVVDIETIIDSIFMSSISCISDKAIILTKLQLAPNLEYLFLGQDSLFSTSATNVNPVDKLRRFHVSV